MQWSGAADDAVCASKSTPVVDAALRRDEARAVQLAEESDQLDAALDCTVVSQDSSTACVSVHRLVACLLVAVLNDVIRREPTYASALNNR
jgi:hypothetical protein